MKMKQTRSRHSGIYIYCLTNSRSLLQDIPTGGMGEAGYYYIDYRQLSLLAREVSLAEFKGHISEDEVDMEWLQSRALEHEKVVEFMMEATDILPFSFGMVLSGAEQARQFLIDNYAQLLEYLDKLGNCSEWNLEGKIDEKQLEQEVRRKDSRIKELEEKIAGSSAGMAHMLKKRLESLIEKKQDILLKELEERVIEEIGSIALDSQLNERKTPRQDLVIDLVYLVAEAGREGFVAAVTRLDEWARELGFQLKLSGPWPVYSFIPQLSEEEEANE